MGLAAMMSKVCSGEPLTELANHLMERLQRNPNDANALMDLSIISHLWFKHDIGLATQARALKVRRLYTLPARSSAKIRLLALMHHGDLAANTPIEFLVQNSDVQLQLLYLDPAQPLPLDLPEHDVVFVAIAESTHSEALLRQLALHAAHWQHPMLNRPERIARLSRDGVAWMLQGVPGIDMPLSARVNREALEQVCAGTLPLASVLADGAFPLIVRPLDSHAGHGLEKVDSAESLLAYLQGKTENTFYLSRFVDYRSGDGLYRKYRIALVDGKAFAGHMAISEHWMIHYANAQMDVSAEKRSEEASFMEGFESGFARRHAEALHAIDRLAGLEYLVIDCAESADGKLLVFEIDSAAVVHAMESVTTFPYKRAHAQKIFQAFRTLLEKTVATANDTS